MIIIAANKRRLFLMVLFFALCFFSVVQIYYGGRLKPVSNDFIGEKYIAIIIDDFGYYGEGTDDILNLGIPITAAVMPGMQSTREDMALILAAATGHDIILHMPMEGHNIKRSWLGEYALTSELGEEQVEQNVLLALESVQYANGLNNHMGSKIMEDEAAVSVVMEIAAEKGLFFIDSVTTNKSVAEKIAREKKVFYLARDVFLDGDGAHDVETVESRLMQGAKIADERGYAVLIGHVGTAGGYPTVKGLQNKIPLLQEQGYTFVTVSQLKDLIEESQMM